jgi:translation initiation factor IF-3
MDYGKYKYEQSKREKEARRHQKNVVLREVRMKPKIDDHDIDFKTRIAQKLLQEGDKVKVTIMFRGREVTHPQIGRDLLDRIVNKLKDVGLVERGHAMEGRFMSVILAPIPPKPEKVAKKEGSGEAPLAEPEPAAAASQ